MAADLLGLEQWQQELQPLEAAKEWATLVEVASQALASSGVISSVEEAYLSYMAGKGLWEQDLWPQAEQLLQRSVELHPHFPYSQHLLGRCHAEAGRWFAALAAQQRCTSLAPGFAYGWHAQGMAALELGDNESAQACFQQALQLDDSLPWFQAHHALAQVRAALGRGAVAEAALTMGQLLARQQPPDPLLQEWLAAAASCALAGERQAALVLARQLAENHAGLGAAARPLPRRPALLLLAALGEEPAELRELAWIPSTALEQFIWSQYLAPLFSNQQPTQLSAALQAVLKVVMPPGAEQQRLLDPLEQRSPAELLSLDASDDPRLPFLQASARVSQASHNLLDLQRNLPGCLGEGARRLQSEPRQHLPLKRLDYHLWQLNSLALERPDRLAQQAGLLPQALALRDQAIDQLCQASVAFTNLDGMGPWPASPQPRRRWLLVAANDLPQCFFYRVEQKQQQLQALGCEVQILFAEKLNEWVCTDLLLWSQAVIICRLPATYPVLRFMARAKRAGLPVFYDIDDLIFDPENFPPPLASYGGTIGPQVHRGLALDVPLFRRAMDQADALIVSTRTLAERWLQLARRGGQAVMVLPNLAPADLKKLGKRQAWQKASPSLGSKAEIVRLVFASGTLAHKQAWNEELAPALAALLRANPQLRLDLIGHISVPEELHDHRQAIRCKPFSDYSSYLKQLGQADIGLAVLEPGIVTDAKSAIKWMEYSLMGLASVVSPTATYREILRPGEDVLLARGADQWQAAIQQLIDQPQLRQQLALRAHERAQQLFASNQERRFWQPLIAAPAPAAPAPGNAPEPRRRKLLVINVFFAPQSVGGATRVAQDQVKTVIEQAGDNYEVTVLCVDHDPWQGLPLDNRIAVDIHQWQGAKVVRLGLPGKPWSWHHDGEVEHFCRWWLAQENFDLIHAHCLQIITAAPLVVAHDLGIPYVVSLHDGWWLSPLQFLISNEGQAVDPADPLGHISNAADESIEKTAAALERRDDLEEILARAAGRWAVSEPFAALYRQAGIRDVTVLENDWTPMQGSIRPTRLPDEPLRICHVGGMAIHKGYPVLRAAILLQPLPNGVVTVIDHSLAEGESYTASWNGTPIQFRAPAPMEQMAEFYASQDVLVAPSTWPESYGLVTREALSAGLWVIASDIGALAEPIEEGVNGNKFPPGDAQALANALAAQAHGARSVSSQPRVELLTRRFPLELPKLYEQAMQR